MVKIKFDKNFLFGANLSAHQSEGKGNIKRGDTVWEMLYESNPDDFINNDSPHITSSFVNNYQDDLKLAKEMNLQAFRTSFSWARLFPDGKTINVEAVKYYHHLIDICQKYNIVLTMNIYHFDLPKWAAKKGGFASEEVVNAYVKYGEFIFQEFGDKLDYILTNCEPSVPIYAGYQSQGEYWVHYPGVVDNELYMQNWWGAILGHSRIANLYNQKYKGKIKAQLGVSLVVPPTYPKDNITYSQEDEKAAKLTFLVRNEIWIKPMIIGHIPPQIWDICQKYHIDFKYTKDQIREIEQTKVDFLALNYYNPVRIQARTKKVDVSEVGIYNFFGEEYKWEKARFNVFRGWEIYPQGIVDAMLYVKNELGNIPFTIAENGIGVEGEHIFKDKEGMIQDDYRISFVSEHLEEIAKGIKQGANCFGYYMWALLDNWSWKNGYKNRYGFIEVDLKTQKRTRKKSFFWYRDIIQARGFDNDYKKVDEVLNLFKNRYYIKKDL